MGHDVFGRAFGADLVGSLAEGERLGLRENVRRKDVVVLTERLRLWRIR